MTAAEELSGIASRYSEVIKRVGNGSLNPDVVERALQDIIDSKPPQGPPTWWRTPVQQLERASQLWLFITLPDPPKVFTPQTESEILLLHVPDSFDGLWNLAVAPAGYTKCRWEDIRADSRNLRFTSKKREYTEPVWLAFDPEHGKGERPDSLWGNANLAGSEVLSALIQFPDWPLAWFDSASTPKLAGYQSRYFDTWTGVPCLTRRDSDRQLRLSARWSGNQHDAWSCPSIRRMY